MSATQVRNSRKVPADLASRSLIVPELDAEPWPSLGGQVCAFIETFLVHGPGDVLGDPVTLPEEARLAIWRLYEVYPQGHEMAGRRRFKRGAIFRCKGWFKTEIAAMLGITELDPDGPVRCDGFDAYGEPVGRPIRDPFIPMVATTEEQSDDLAFGAARKILENCDLGNSYDVGVEMISPKDAPGKMASYANAPLARDGARTTFQHFDETHGFVRESQKRGHAVMLRNIGKRKGADGWSLETSVMYAPGELSVAEATHDYALDIARGLIQDPRLYFDHRQASLVWDLKSRAQLRKAVEEACGDATYIDVDAIVASYDDPTTDRNEHARNHLNQRRVSAGRWLNPDAYEPLQKRRRIPRDGTCPVVLGFDGSTSRDSTALVAATIEKTPHIMTLAVWEKPRSLGHVEWRVSRLDVEAALDKAVRSFDVREIAPDPHGWHREVEEWADKYGDIVVIFDTAQPSRMGPAADEFFQAVKDRAVTFEPSEPMMRHLANCRKKIRSGYTVPDGTHQPGDQIDLAIAAVIAKHRAGWHHLNPRVKRAWGLVK